MNVEDRANAANAEGAARNDATNATVREKILARAAVAADWKGVQIAVARDMLMTLDSRIAIVVMGVVLTSTVYGKDSDNLVRIAMVRVKKSILSGTTALLAAETARLHVRDAVGKESLANVITVREQAI